MIFEKGITSDKKRIQMDKIMKTPFLESSGLYMFGRWKDQLQD